MRLIDADIYLKKICKYEADGCGSCKFQTVCPVDEPTVKAIPVEWIRNYASHKASKDMMDCYWHFWENVLKMIDVWEKENGISQ